VSPRYPIVEALGGAASIAVLELVVFPMAGESVVRASAIYLTDFGTILALIATAFIDFEWMYIPDAITYGGTVVGIATSSFRGYTLLSAAIAAVAGFVITWVPFVFLYRVARGRSGMGLGDAKLLMMAGAYFGIFGVVWALLAGAVQGVVGAFALWLLRGKIGLPEAVKQELEELKKAAAEGDEEAKAILADDPLAQDDDPDKPAYARVAFGPFLALAFVELMLYRDVILDYIHTNFWI
jgi:leader peptidase (prepilin peptidase)/N-methyltransferase